MSWDDDDDVGYGRPPKWTRFKKGKSGNRNGRPKRVKPQPKPAPTESEQDDALRDALNKHVEITEGGKRVKVKAGELLPKLHISAAVKGSETAQRYAMDQARELEARDQERAAIAEEQRIKIYHFMVSERDDQARAWQAAAANGFEPVQPWPHWDDFIFKPSDHAWRIRGPSRAEDVPVFEKIRADRDILLAQAAIELKRGRKRLHLVKFYGIIGMQLDVYLPLRWQTGVEKWTEMCGQLSGQPMPLLRAILAHFERRSLRLTPILPDREHDKQVYETTNRIMQPLLRKNGYRSLKQFRAAYAELGNDMPWPRRRVASG